MNSAVSAQGVTLTPTTVCKGSTCAGSPETTVPEIPHDPTKISDVDVITETKTVTETQVTTEVKTETQSVTETTTSVITSVQEVTVTEEVTRIVTFTTDRVVERTSTITQAVTLPCAPQAACPTLTRTGTACRTCLLPGCVTSVRLTRSCGCPAALPTSTVNFACNDNDPGVCNRIGCTTVYDVVTQAGC